jgi:beta-lactamase regulating signal transducer with metallopeptidase domain
MNPLWAAVYHPLANRVGWMLLHSLWQGALIGLCFVLLRFALRKQSAQSRYLAGCVCLTLMVAAPVLTLCMNPAPLHETGTGGFTVSPTAPIPAAQNIPNTSLPRGENRIEAAIESVAIFLSQLAPWLTAAWLAGVALSSCKLLRSFWWVRTVRTKETNIVEADLIERLNRLRRRLSISRPVRLLKSALVEVPTVVGWLRPVILLPASTLAGLTPGQLEAVLVHELAHVRRFDFLVNAFQCLIETLMFYHPVVWWVSRGIREERENCCDDLVVEVCGNRVAYARALATLEELRAETPQFAFAASGGSLLNRVRRLLGASDGEEPIKVNQVGGIALIGIGLLFILLGVHLTLAKPMYRASTRIKVERETSAQVGSENGKFTLTVWDPYFAQNLLEELRSETVLQEVVNNLGLSEDWAKRYNLPASPHRAAQITDLLRRRMAVQPIRNTVLFEISCLDENPEEAKAIANGIAEAYRNYRIEQRQKSVQVGMKSLELRAAEQEDLVRNAQREVDRLRDELNIPPAVAMEQSPAEAQNLSRGMVGAETLRKLEGMRVELEGQIMREETLLVGLKSLSRDKLIYALPTAAPDTLLTSLLEQKSYAEQALIVKRSDAGEQHPEVVKLKSQVEHLTTRLNERVDGILLGLDQRLSSEKEQLNKLIKEVEAMKQDDAALAQKSRPYFEARRKLSEAERFGQALNMKIASESIDAALPKPMTVEIMDAAMTPFRPVYPNRSKAAALILLGILLDFGGLRMMRTRPPLTPILQPA